MSDDLARAFAFVERADMAGTRVAPFRWGRAVFMPVCPLRHDSNYLLVDALPEEVDAPALAAEADRVQGAAGLEHRSILVRDADLGERLVPGFEALGWKAFRGLVMIHRGAAPRSVDTARVSETDAAALREARTREILGYPWSTPEVARQLLDARAWIDVDTRHFAVFDDGAPVSWCELYLEDGVAQVEAVATVEAFRNRGHASAVVARAVEEAEREGAGLVFLVCDAEDWPRILYRRLGFVEEGRYVKLHRT